MKRLILAIALITISALGFAPAAQAQQGNCVLPGDILDVPTPGFLRNATPQPAHPREWHVVAGYVGFAHHQPASCQAAERRVAIFNSVSRGPC